MLRATSRPSDSNTKWSKEHFPIHVQRKMRTKFTRPSEKSSKKSECLAIGTVKKYQARLSDPGSGPVEGLAKFIKGHRRGDDRMLACYST
jgi:hypothetical protein